MPSEYPPDPGGQFDSDVHRRVQAAVGNYGEEKTDLDEVLRRVAADTQLDLSAEEVEEVLADLEAAGHSKQTKDGWQNTADGFKLLTGPPAGVATGEGAPADLSLEG